MVFGVVDPLNAFFNHFSRKALLCVNSRRLSHQPSMLVQAFDLWTCVRKKDCMKEGMVWAREWFAYDIVTDANSISIFENNSDHFWRIKLVILIINMIRPNV